MYLNTKTKPFHNNSKITTGRLVYLDGKKDKEFFFSSKEGGEEDIVFYGHSRSAVDRCRELLNSRDLEKIGTDFILDKVTTRVRALDGCRDWIFDPCGIEVPVALLGRITRGGCNIVCGSASSADALWEQLLICRNNGDERCDFLRITSHLPDFFFEQETLRQVDEGGKKERCVFCYFKDSRKALNRHYLVVHKLRNWRDYHLKCGFSHHCLKEVKKHGDTCNSRKVLCGGKERRKKVSLPEDKRQGKNPRPILLNDRFFGLYLDSFVLKQARFQYNTNTKLLGSRKYKKAVQTLVDLERKSFEELGTMEVIFPQAGGLDVVELITLGASKLSDLETAVGSADVSTMLDWLAWGYQQVTLCRHIDGMISVVVRGLIHIGGKRIMDLLHPLAVGLFSFFVKAGLAVGNVYDSVSEKFNEYLDKIHPQAGEESTIASEENFFSAVFNGVQRYLGEPVSALPASLGTGLRSGSQQIRDAKTLFEFLEDMWHLITSYFHSWLTGKPRFEDDIDARAKSLAEEYYSLPAAPKIDNVFAARIGKLSADANYLAGMIGLDCRKKKGYNVQGVAAIIRKIEDLSVSTRAHLGKSARCIPIAVNLHGPPGVGKSGFLTLLGDCIVSNSLEKRGLDPELTLDKNLVYPRSSDDTRYDGWTNENVVMLYDDALQNSDKAIRAETIVEWIKIMSPAPIFFSSAHLSDKGNLRPDNLEAILISANLDVSKVTDAAYITDWTAVTRRFTFDATLVCVNGIESAKRLQVENAGLSFEQWESNYEVLVTAMNGRSVNRRYSIRAFIREVLMRCDAARQARDFDYEKRKDALNTYMRGDKLVEEPRIVETQVPYAPAETLSTGATPSELYVLITAYRDAPRSSQARAGILDLIRAKSSTMADSLEAIERVVGASEQPVEMDLDVPPIFEFQGNSELSDEEEGADSEGFFDEEGAICMDEFPCTEDGSESSGSPIFEEIKSKGKEREEHDSSAPKEWTDQSYWRGVRERTKLVRELVEPHQFGSTAEIDYDMYHHLVVVFEKTYLSVSPSDYCPLDSYQEHWFPRKKADALFVLDNDVFRSLTEEGYVRRYLPTWNGFRKFKEGLEIDNNGNPMVRSTDLGEKVASNIAYFRHRGHGRIIRYFLTMIWILVAMMFPSFSLPIRMAVGGLGACSTMAFSAMYKWIEGVAARVIGMPKARKLAAALAILAGLGTTLFVVRMAVYLYHGKKKEKDEPETKEAILVDTPDTKPTADAVVESGEDKTKRHKAKIVRLKQKLVKAEAKSIAPEGSEDLEGADLARKWLTHSIITIRFERNGKYKDVSLQGVPYYDDMIVVNRHASVILANSVNVAFERGDAKRLVDGRKIKVENSANDLSMWKVPGLSVPDMRKHFASKYDIGKSWDQEIVILTKRTAPVMMYLGEPQISNDSFMMTQDETEITISQSITGRANTLPGDCGGMYVSMNPNLDGRIVAIHSGFARGRAFGMFTLKEELERLALKLGSRLEAYMYEQFLESEPSIESMDRAARNCFPGVDMIGVLKPGFGAFPRESKREIVSSPLVSDVVEELVPSFKVVRFNPHKVKGKLIEPQKIMSAKFQALCRVEFADYFSDVINSAMLLYSSKPRLGEVRTLDDIISGYEFAEVSGVTYSTSPGFPEKKLFKGKGKEKFVEYSEDNQKKPSDLCRVLFTQNLERVEKGTFLPVFVDSLKSETLPAEKVDAGKVRRFCTGRFVDYLVEEAYLGCFYETVRSRSTFSCVGVNLSGAEFGFIGKALLAVPNAKFIALDGQSWDIRLAHFLRHAAVLYIQGWYSLYFPTSAYTNVRTNILLGHLRTLHLWKDTVYVQYGGMDSGKDSTAENNNICHLLAYIILFYVGVNDSAHPERKVVGDPIRFFKAHSKIFVYGDDSVLAIDSEKMGWFDQFYVRDAMQKLFNMTMTMAKKEAEMTRFTEFEDLTFLSRKWRKLEGSILVGQLEERTITNIPLFIRTKTQSVAMATQQNVDCAMREWFLYGREKFDHMKAVYNRAMLAQGIAPFTLSYDDLLDEFVKAMA